MLQVEHSAILSAFIKLPILIRIFVLSIFEWPFYTGFTVCSGLKLRVRKEKLISYFSTKTYVVGTTVSMRRFF